MHAGAAAERLHQVGELRFCASLSLPAEATLRIFPRSGSTAWLARSRACLAEPPAESPSTMKISEPSAAVLVQSASLPGRRSLRTARLARDLLFLPPADALVGALDHEVEQLVGLRRVAGEPMIERVLDRLLDDALRLGGGQPVLGLALELGLADEHRQHGGGAHHHVLAGDRRRALALADALGVVLEAAQQRGCAGPTRACRRRGSGSCCSRTRRSRRRPPPRRSPIRPCRGCRSCRTGR